MAAITTGELVQVVWVSLTASAAVATTFALAVLAAVHSVEARRRGSQVGAGAYAGLAALAIAVFAGLVALGVHIMLSKS